MIDNNNIERIIIRKNHIDKDFHHNIANIYLHFILEPAFVYFVYQLSFDFYLNAIQKLLKYFLLLTIQSFLILMSMQ
jgi:hypothetical protein